MTLSRPVYRLGINYGNGGADVVAESAAALAAGSIAFKESGIESLSW